MQTWRNLWLYMSYLGRICSTLIERFWKMILFRWLRTTLILVDHETSCVGNHISLSFHAYEECPNQRLYVSCASIWRKGGPGPQDWLEIRLCNSELDWISTLVCASPCLSTPSWCPTCPPWSTPSSRGSLRSHGSERRRECARIQTCLVVVTWRKGESNIIYRQRVRIDRE
jgi:hypothetical protein